MVIIPAVAGPFDLGAVVSRIARSTSTPKRARPAPVSDPLPQIIDGVPTDTALGRAAPRPPGLLAQPDLLRRRGLRRQPPPRPWARPRRSSSASRSAAAAPSPTSPRLCARLYGPIHRGGHPRLRSVFTARPGEANTARVSFALPHSEFIDQAHFRTICTRVQFAADACPAGSVYGQMKAITPLLEAPAEGPIYLRSSSHELPDVVAALHGPPSQPIEVDLDGRVDSVHGGVRTTFAAVPDAPVTKAIVTMQGKRKGLFQNSTNICKGTHRATLQASTAKTARPTTPAPAEGHLPKARSARRTPSTTAVAAEQRASPQIVPSQSSKRQEISSHAKAQNEGAAPWRCWPWRSPRSASPACAQAKLRGNFTKFEQCPYTNTEVKKCIYSVTESGEVVLGAKKVPIEKPVDPAGRPRQQPTKASAPFFAATNGVTLSKAPQNVPGGLLGIVPETKQSWLVKALIKFFFENSLTGVNSTLELAKPATEIKVTETNLAGEEGVALKMPVKVHLENPFLGKNCYVGSSSSPIAWEPDHRQNRPPAPNKSITGAAGESRIPRRRPDPRNQGTELVDNAWSAPGGHRLRRASSPSWSPRSSTRSSAPPPPGTTRRSSTTRSTSPRPPRCAKTTKKTPKAKMRKEMMK